MILDDLLLHPGDGRLVLQDGGGDGGGRLHGLGRLRVRLEALVLLDVGEREVTLRELQVTAGLQLRVMLRLTWTRRSKKGHQFCFFKLILSS